MTPPKRIQRTEAEYAAMQADFEAGNWKAGSIIDMPDRVILRGQLAVDVVLGIGWEQTPSYDTFLKLFEVDPHDYLVSDDFYKGTEFLRVITRKRDGRKFGYKYWDSPGNDSLEADYGSNGEEHGIVYEFDDDFEVVGGESWVFLPVCPSTIPTFRFIED